ncbi:hypothetical protein A2210_00505 [Candidatus Woesebacteria bacterium RIFOXYA1_FULL_40_18]|uniref:Bifunctional protein GlmU n=2 Tax=Candidatus Woeseibacteriota TaxID=1752722 RepID=A0A0G0SMR5_9BACT|nr:MAG: Bifunctional protein GlmU [Candidatus Woesebacteria bacterium GW2011_GWA1_40_45]OGM76446.1 MAG: hypothetical protein A2210_00505 [Candidatus Woesebacteria bacterium RIFOXYA1_FULL_40_18]
MKERADIILAAGLGTRLNLPDRPKVMAGLYDKPILHHTIETLLGTDPDQIIIVVGHKREVITRYFGGGFCYCTQENLSGNATALKIGLNGVPPDVKNLLVLQGDDSAFYYKKTISDILRIHSRSGADITVLLTDDFAEKTHKSQFVVSSEGEILSYKRRILNPREGNFFTGTACFKKNFLQNLLSRLSVEENGEVTIPQLFQLALASNLKICGVKAKQGEWVGINTSVELQIARNLMSLREKES